MVRYRHDDGHIITVMTLPWFTLSCEPVWRSYDYCMSVALFPLNIPAHISPTVTWLITVMIHVTWTCFTVTWLLHDLCTPPLNTPTHTHDSHILYTPLCPQIHWREKHHSRSFWKLNTNKLNFSNISPSRLSLLHQSLCVCFLSNYTYLQATVSNHCLAWIGYDQLEV